jgi:hypothetical protein
MTYLVLCILCDFVLHYDVYYIFIFSPRQFNLFLKHKSYAIITLLLTVRFNVLMKLKSTIIQARLNSYQLQNNKWL